MVPDCHMGMPAEIRQGQLEEKTKETFLVGRSPQSIHRSAILHGALGSDTTALFMAARAKQTERFSGTKLITNSEMSSTDVRRVVLLNASATALMTTAIDRFRLSARAYYRILKIARTIADLANEDSVQESHVAEALQFRGVEA